MNTNKQRQQWSLPAASGGSNRFKPPGRGFPTYIWMAAGGTTILLGYGYFAFLDEVPLTRRTRWIATSPELENEMGDQEYAKLLKHFRKDVLPTYHRAHQTVERVGSRVAAAALDFAKNNNLKDYSSRQYTYTVIRSDMANAFVLPGNHVFVMTGLFRYVRDEDDLAAVLGHELAHNLARHPGEKISGSLIINLLARLSLLIDPSGLMISILLPAATVFRELPNSRTQEVEADQIGVHLAAKACYDPRAAKRVFLAMKSDQHSSQRAPPEFLSTHPSHDSRLTNFDHWMPDAMMLYGSDGGERCRHVREDMARGRAIAARQAVLVEARLARDRH